MSIPTPCPGCGTKTSRERCIGCGHIFGDELAMTPTPTHTAVPRVQATAPERIYLVIGEDVEPDTDFAELDRLGGVTWCADKIDGNSIPYVRGDLASLPAPQGEQQRTVNDRILSIPIGRTPGDKWTLAASQDSRTPTVAPGGLPLPQADSQDDVRWTLVHSLVASKGWMRGYAEAYVDAALSGDSVLPPVEPPGATLSPCAASTAITPAIADALAKARVFALCALRRDGYRFTFHDEVERWAELLLESVDKATSQVDRGESSSPSVAASE